MHLTATKRNLSICHTCMAYVNTCQLRKLKVNIDSNENLNRYSLVSHASAYIYERCTIYFIQLGECLGGLQQGKCLGVCFWLNECVLAQLSAYRRHAMKGFMGNNWGLLIQKYCFILDVVMELKVYENRDTLMQLFAHL